MQTSRRGRRASREKMKGELCAFITSQQDLLYLRPEIGWIRRNGTFCIIYLSDAPRDGGALSRKAPYSARHPIG